MDVSQISTIVELIRQGFHKVQDLQKGPLVVTKNSMAIFRRKDNNDDEYLIVVYRNSQDEINFIDERLLVQSESNEELQNKIDELHAELQKLKTSIKNRG